MSEMNWPDGPDPFHYREHRNGWPIAEGRDGRSALI
jgi:hypothetical protein